MTLSRREVPRIAGGTALALPLAGGCADPARPSSTRVRPA